MRNTTFIFLVIFLTFLFVACGNDNSTTDENQEIVQLKGHEELDLNQWGFPMVIMVPDAENHGEPQVVLTNRGALEIVVGNSFGIEIMYGEGDIQLLKMDLEEDLVFVSEIVSEEENLLVYKQDIPESGVKTQHHFFYKATINNDIYEIRDLQSEQFGEKMIQDMIKAVKTIRYVAASSTAKDA
ncbi:MAG: hypothetical protein P1U44_12920 [Vicingaceae bacterium]|jgi:hypothetical protein|nr:hypothetical protein [Flavobacteriales bacterium]MBQ19206.1 hypothetical protein [Flavobacteriales bacterium]MDF1676609.1 hypothetical protein [Vicingaceae bacterium]|tara:strand:- start:57101 stop:57652 length:552 start_codon:yes stop_codon:yes gene_type:complete